MRSPKEKRLSIIRRHIPELNERLEDRYSTWVEQSERELLMALLDFLKEKEYLNSNGQKFHKEYSDWCEANPHA